MVDIAKLKAEAVTKKEIARQKIEAAKRQATDNKAVKANPIPKYVNLPELSGDAQEDSLKDLGELELGFRKRAADENNRFALATDSEFWGVVCFQTREQRDTFFAALKVLDLGNMQRYFDGCAIAKRLGIALPDAAVPYKATVKPDPAWVEFS